MVEVLVLFGSLRQRFVIVSASLQLPLHANLSTIYSVSGLRRSQIIFSLDSI